MKKDNEKVYLWYSKSTSVTGKKLKERLNIKGGTSPPKEEDNIDLIICWGGRLPKYLNNSEIDRLKDYKYLNNVFRIEDSSNKLKALEIIKESVKIPKCYKYDGILKALEDKEINYPIISRTIRHYGGSGFKLCLQKKDLLSEIEPNKYFLEFILSQKEYRVHVFKGEILRVGIKMECEEGSTNEWVKSRSNGWVIKNISSSTLLPLCVVREAICAVKELGLDIGGVDIIHSDDNKAYVLEVNTGMGLDDKGLEIYTNAIIKELRRENLRIIPNEIEEILVESEYDSNYTSYPLPPSIN